MFTTTTTRYEEVTSQRRHYGNCPICKKKVTRQKTFVNTINPFNKNKDGTIRTYSEVLNCVEKKADEWVPDFTHDKCK